MFGKSQKKKNHLDKVRKIWQGYQAGHHTADEARNQVHDISGGIKKLDWEH
jgi:hypothetical protein